MVRLPSDVEFAGDNVRRAWLRCGATRSQGAISSVTTSRRFPGVRVKLWKSVEKISDRAAGDNGDRDTGRERGGIETTPM